MRSRILFLLSFATISLSFAWTSNPIVPSRFERFAVAADHPLASQAGSDVLARGGNAVDAAIATALALGVVSPSSSGLGGGGFAMVYRASDRSTHFIDFREKAPAAATAEIFRSREGDTERAAAQRSQVGGLAVATPGEPAGLDYLFQHFGSHRLQRRDLVSTSVRLAREGFPASRFSARYSRMTTLLRRDSVYSSWFGTSGQVETGATVRNVELASTLEVFGREGSRPFYQGRIARDVVRAVRENGGVLSLEDLRAYRVEERDPLMVDRLGYRLALAPLPSAGGEIISSSLQLLDIWNQNLHARDANASLFQEGALLRHALAESWKGPFVDRQFHYGDPSVTTIPFDLLRQSSRVQARAELFDPMRARPAIDYALPIGASNAQAVEDHGTSHLCVVDSEGNIVSITTTVNLPFGSQIQSHGMLLNDEMDDFAREVGAANAFGLRGGGNNLPGPGKRPISSMSPTIVFEHDQPILCLGASGGSRILTAVEQVFLFHLVMGDQLDAAIRRPRVHHQGNPDVLSVEEHMPSSVRLGLMARGHRMVNVEASAVAQAIRIHRNAEGASEWIEAISDPRKDGEARGQ